MIYRLHVHLVRRVFVQVDSPDNRIWHVVTIVLHGAGSDRRWHGQFTVGLQQLLFEAYGRRRIRDFRGGRFAARIVDGFDPGVHVLLVLSYELYEYAIPRLAFIRKYNIMWYTGEDYMHLIYTISKNVKIPCRRPNRDFFVYIYEYIRTTCELLLKHIL